MSQQSPKPKRQRGRLLTDKGWDKLRGAINSYQDKENVKLTNESISEMAKLEFSDTLGVAAISKIKNRKEGVDKSSLEKIFRVFQLKLEDDDWERLKNSQPNSQKIPGVDGEFYLERSNIENICYTQILEGGPAIRIESPWQMGKTSLIDRILEKAKQHNYLTICLRFRLIDDKFFTNLDTFLQYFCTYVSHKLQRIEQNIQPSSNLENYWDGFVGSKVLCKDYFEDYILSQITQPIVLALDDVDIVHTKPTIAEDFFDILRMFDEEKQRNYIWKKLRLVLAYSKQFKNSRIHLSPHNLGIPINLLEWEEEEVLNLASQYQLNWKIDEVKSFMKMFGGHPYLAKTAFENISRQFITLEKLLETAHTTNGIYRIHLETLWNSLSEDSKLTQAMKKVVDADENQSVRLTQEERLGLRRMGLVKLERGNRVLPLCQLYRQYFQERLKFNE